MKTLQIEENKAKELYKTASTEFRAMLEDTFGREFFKTKITDRIKTFEDACDVLNINPFNGFSVSDTKDEIAYKKLKIIARALNEGWTPDWENSSQYKWYPWFRIKSGFAFSVFDCAGTHSHVGSRLCFSSEKLAEYAGKQFENIYKDFLI